MPPDYFQNARDFTIVNGNFSHVEGDQHYHTHHYSSTTQIIHKRQKRRTEFDDVSQVKSGAICTVGASNHKTKT
ncbi:hypothetical protein PQX77_014536 [Marasmius sp. AFHP31]|nr:hypothetical protein PQX77_014536 [Marasmius sp. AFHP31]